MVGCGAIGARHAALAVKYGHLLAVCDIDSNRVRRFSKSYECFGYTSFDEMLKQQKEAEVLIVCTPNGLHAKHSIAGLKAGMHVLCEKPMALKGSDCRKMIQASKKANKHLMIVKQNRLNPPVIAVKELLTKNKLGKIFSIQINCFWNRNSEYYNQSNWKGTRNMDGGVLFTQFSHFIDLLYWFFGDIKEAKGYIENRGHLGITQIEDTGVFSFITKSGVPGTLHYTTNSNKRNYEGSVTIFSEKATIKIGGAYLNCIEYQQPVLIKKQGLSKGNPENIYKGYTGSMNNHVGVYQEMLNLIAGRKNRIPNSYEALKSVEMIQLLYNM